MVHRRASAWIVAGLLLLLARGSVLADDASAFAPQTVADLLARGTEVERRWGRHVLAHLPEPERAKTLATVRRLEDASREERRSERVPSLPRGRVTLRLRYFLAHRVLLRDLGLQTLWRDSPPYPSEAERRAGAPLLEARPGVDVLARLHEAIADGRLVPEGTDEQEAPNGGVSSLAALRPPSGSPAEDGVPPAGAVLTVQAGFTGPPRLGGLSLRRIVAVQRAADGGIRMRGSAHRLDPSWGIHLVVRNGEVVLFSPRWSVGRPWAGDLVPLLEVVVRFVPDVVDRVIDVSLPRKDAPSAPRPRRRLAPVEAVEAEGRRVVFRVGPTDRVFFGERLVVARGDPAGTYVTVVEVVGIEGTRIEARSVAVLQKHTPRAGDHVVWWVPER